MTDLEEFVIWSGRHGHYTILSMYQNFLAYKETAAEREAEAKYQRAVPDVDLQEL